METKVCTLTSTDGNDVIATVTYRTEGDGTMTGYKLENSSAFFPYSTPDMSLSIMLNEDGSLSTAAANLNDDKLTEVFACTIGDGAAGNSFQWINDKEQYNSEDHCEVSYG